MCVQFKRPLWEDWKQKKKEEEGKIAAIAEAEEEKMSECV